MAMAEAFKLPIKLDYQFETAVARPGDTIVVGVRRDLSEEEIHRATRMFKTLTGDVCNIVIVPDCSGLVVLTGDRVSIVEEGMVNTGE